MSSSVMYLVRGRGRGRGRARARGRGRGRGKGRGRVVELRHVLLEDGARRDVGLMRCRG